MVWLMSYFSLKWYQDVTASIELDIIKIVLIIHLSFGNRHNHFVYQLEIADYYEQCIDKCVQQFLCKVLLFTIWHTAENSIF